MQSKRCLRGLLFASVVALAATALPLAAASPAAASATCPTTLSFATTVSCSLGVTGEIDAFSVAASAGDAILLHVVGATGSGLDVDLDMRDPSGAVVCTSRAGASAEAVCKITSAGKYTVAVFDSGSDDTGAYRLEAQRINRPVRALGLAISRPRHGVIKLAGENDWYTFAGAANAVVVARGAVLGSPIEVDLDVFSAAGDVVCATRAGASAQVACTLPATGIYSVRVDDGADDETGAYALTVRPECTINGTSGADTITGTAGADVICALGGADKVAAGDGDDVVIGGTSDDALDGGAGNDVFIMERTADGADTVAGGLGVDVLSYAERGGAVSVDADVVADDGELNERDDVRADVETLFGGAGNDRLLGSSANNTLIGGLGDDVVDGATGDDTLVSSSEPDGADVLVGGGGRDHVTYAERAASVAADPDAVGDDGSAGERDNIAADIENVTGGAGGDTIVGTSAANTLRGGAGDDTLVGGAGYDTLDGGTGRDRCDPGADDARVANCERA